VKNTDGNLNVEVAFDNNFAAPPTGKLFALLLPDQFCLVPVYPGAHVWARPASGGPVDVQVAAVEA
jgi:hypothetical protein